MTGYRIGVDVGGTFTDCVLRRPDGSIVLEKAPTTPADQSDGVLAGIARLSDAEGVPLDALLAATDRIVHGTTTGDNTMIQMSGAATGLLVTEGFRDEIELRRCYKEDIWDPALPPPTPIARRRDRLEVHERVDAEGGVVVALDEDGVRRAVDRLRRLGVESIAVSLLHSYRNPAHELRVRELIEEVFPEVALVSLSHEVLPKPPEFERTSTTLVNAYVGPVISRYLDRCAGRLADAGYQYELLVATASGGIATPSRMRRLAVATIGSGPSGGVVAAARAAQAAGLGDCVSVDMGGTSYDVCLIRDGRPDVKADWNWRHRYCIALPMVDVHSVGAGGGSIARVDEGGHLQVGPDSAGSVPGPVCYGRGGSQPTVTDADLLLGRLDPAGFAGGRMTLDVDAARAALAAIGEPLGLDAEGAAAAVVEIVDAHLTDAVRRVLSLAGEDPRRLDLVAFGGMGGVHATTQAAALGMARVLLPRAAPGFSALGLLTADHVVDLAHGHLSPWAEADPAVLERICAQLEAAADAELDVAGVPVDRRRHEWLLNLVYPGQTFDVPLPLERDPVVTGAAVAAAVEEFHRRNEAARLIEARAQEPIVRGVRLVATGLVEQPAPAELAAATGRPAPVGTRRLWAGGTWHHDAPVFDDEALGAGATIVGPAVIRSRFTALVLRPGDRATVLSSGDLLVTLP